MLHHGTSFAISTVAAAPASGAAWIRDGWRAIADNWQAWALAAGAVVVAAVVGLVLHAIVSFIIGRMVRRTAWGIDNLLHERLRRPSRWLIPLLCIQLAVARIVADLPTTERAGEAAAGVLEPRLPFITHLLSLAIIAAATWLVLAAIGAGEVFVKLRHDIDRPDNLEARRVHTQITVLSRTIMVFVVIIGAAVALMTFPRVRELGVSLLASAGVAGLAVGLAARPVLENIIAGLQLALTQPIRLDDVVIIDGEWGRIEEITTTYVVVRIWDQRRLIVPFSKFISDSFQNWTRTTADILGTVFIYTDYTVPVQQVRDKLNELVQGHEKWDGRVCVLQVTDATEHTMQLRAVVSAATSGDAWDLRVDLREKLIDFLQREHPDALPRTRIALTEREPAPPQPEHQS